MTTISPQPFPEDGARKLSPKENMQRANALACTMPQDNKPACSGQVFVGIFFDGTGNNMRNDYESLPPEKRKHTNVVKIFQTYPSTEEKSGHFRFYIPGVGTPFPEIGDVKPVKTSFTAAEKAEAATKSGAILGSTAGEDAEPRIIWAFTRLLNAPHQFVFNDAPLIPDGLAKDIANVTGGIGQPGAGRRSVLNNWQDKLKAALEGKKPKVEQINLSVFGFSRGSAEARAFVNWLFEVCKQEGGGWTFAGIRIRVQFLGIFDTVASVGLANLFDNGLLAGHQSWADDNLEIHPGVERCVHYVAGHEVRACFPSDSVRIKSSYPSNAMEVMYPGSHSDVGGGYPPGALGVSPTPDAFMAIIPGVNMYHEARKSGVPLWEWDSLPKGLQKSLTPSPTVVKDFNAYLAAANIGNGPIEELARKHMAMFFSYRFKNINSNDYYRTKLYQQATDKDKSYLYTTQRSLFLQMSQLKRLVIENEPNLARKWPFLKKYGTHLDNASRSWDEISATPSRAAEIAWRIVPGVAQVLDGIALFNKYQKKLSFEYALEVANSINLEKVTPEVETFFDNYIHDSMAGFIGFGMDEFKYNGIGIVKFRTIYKSTN
jgi:hypothetical protein